MTNNQLFSKEHLWFLQEANGDVTVGITGILLDFYPIDFWEIQPVGTIISANSTLGVLETAKTAIELILPFAAEIQSIRSNPPTEIKSHSNNDWLELWICKVKPLDTAWTINLMSKEIYEQFLN